MTVSSQYLETGSLAQFLFSDTCEKPEVVSQSLTSAPTTLCWSMKKQISLKHIANHTERGVVSTRGVL